MKLEEIEKLCNGATPGPWDISLSPWADHITTLQHPKDWPNPIIFHPPKEMHDAKFIAASRTLMPKLLEIAKIAKELSSSIQVMSSSDNEPPTKWVLLQAKLLQLENE